MKGFKLRSNISQKEEFIQVGIPEGSVSVMLSITKDMGASWKVLGLTNDLTHLSWVSGKNLNIGDEIEVEAVRIDSSDPYDDQIKHSELVDQMSEMMKNTKNDEEVWKEKFEQYHRLRKILLDEGLITDEVIQKGG